MLFCEADIDDAQLDDGIDAYVGDDLTVRGPETACAGPACEGCDVCLPPTGLTGLLAPCVEFGVAVEPGLADLRSALGGEPVREPVAPASEPTLEERVETFRQRDDSLKQELRDMQLWLSDLNSVLYDQADPRSAFSMVVPGQPSYQDGPYMAMVARRRQAGAQESVQMLGLDGDSTGGSARDEKDAEQDEAELARAYGPRGEDRIVPQMADTFRREGSGVRQPDTFVAGGPSRSRIVMR